MTAGVAPDDSSDKVIRIGYLKIHDTEYPRNQRIRNFLSTRDHPKFLVREYGSRQFSFSARDVSSILRAARENDILLLAEFQLKHAALSRIATFVYRKLHVVDCFVMRYETEVEDWRRANRRSLRAVAYRAIDAAALRCADIALTDTEVRAASLRVSSSRSTRIVSLPVGAPRALLSPEFDHDLSSLPWEGEGRRRVLFYGNYLPLHGALQALRALCMVASHQPLSIVFVGRGGDRGHVQREARKLPGSSHIVFLDSLPFDELSALIKTSDVVLGIFGESEKAATVIPNKVWQGLAAGIPVVTRRSRALDEIRAAAGDLLIEADPADLDSISRGIIRALNTERRNDVGGALEAYVDGKFTDFLNVLTAQVLINDRTRKTIRRRQDAE